MTEHSDDDDDDDDDGDDEYEVGYLMYLPSNHLEWTIFFFVFLVRMCSINFCRKIINATRTYEL